MELPVIEEWRPISGLEHMYRVSNFGRVRSVTRKIPQGNRWGGTTIRTWKGKVLSLHRCKTTGYDMIVFYEKGFPDQCFGVHVLVCTAFNGPKPSDDHEVNHKNGIKHDNRPDNLEWLTHADNNRHAFETGLNPGNGPHLSKESVSQMRAAWDAGGVTQKELAARFGCAESTVSTIVNYKERIQG